jgi:hypothetical protein
LFIFLHFKGLKVDKIQTVELKITDRDGKVMTFTADHLIRQISDTEEMLVVGTYSTFSGISTGSIIIILQTESTYSMTKLKHFIESKGISRFLKRLFESSDIQRLLTKDKYTIDVQIRGLQEPTATGKEILL